MLGIAVALFSRTWDREALQRHTAELSIKLSWACVSRLRLYEVIRGHLRDLSKSFSILYTNLLVLPIMNSACLESGARSKTQTTYWHGGFDGTFGPPLPPGFILQAAVPVVIKRLLLKPRCLHRLHSYVLALGRMPDRFQKKSSSKAGSRVSAICITDIMDTHFLFAFLEIP